MIYPSYLVFMSLAQSKVPGGLGAGPPWAGGFSGRFGPNEPTDLLLSRQQETGGRFGLFGGGHDFNRFHHLVLWTFGTN